MNKTANQLWKEYRKDGGTQSFKDWMNREKKKGFVNFDGNATVPVNKNLNDSLQSVLDKLHRNAGLKTEPENTYIFGIHKNILIGVGVVGLAALGFVIYKNRKK